MSGTILVTGGSGQLATSLAHAGGERIRRVGRPEFDFDRPETIEKAFGEVGPAIVVNAAAFTAVDLAESEKEASARANHEGPKRLAELCAEAGIPLIHVSTDYVYDGTKGAPYVETDPTAPTGVYGRTKLDGEQAVLAANSRTIVLRTSWVFSPFGKNFIKTMLNAQLKTSNLKVVADQHGSPTSAPNLADAILAITRRIETDGFEPSLAGVYHAANRGFTTWHGLATATFEEAERHGRTMPNVAAITTSDWPTPATRPADTRLDCAKLERVFGVTLPEWRPSLARAVDEVLTSA
jgi:dTDP-4-dehydrorhamnose reductase